MVLWILPRAFPCTYRALTVSGSASQLILLRPNTCWQSATPVRFPVPVWAPPRSLAATEGISVDSFSSGYLDVSVHRVPFLSDDSTPAAGFPHSDTCGSMVTCTSPQLFAAYRVLLRLIWPRHPPYALTCLTLCLHLSEFLRFVKSFSFSKKRFVRFVLCSCQGTGLSSRGSWPLKTEQCIAYSRMPT